MEPNCFDLSSFKLSFGNILGDDIGPFRDGHVKYFGYIVTY